MRTIKSRSVLAVLFVSAMAAGCGGSDSNTGSDTQVRTIITQNDARSLFLDTRANDEDIRLLNLVTASSAGGHQQITKRIGEHSAFFRKVALQIAEKTALKDQIVFQCGELSDDQNCSGRVTYDASYRFDERQTTLPNDSFISISYENFQADDYFGGVLTTKSVRLDFPDGMSTSQPFEGRVRITNQQELPVASSYTQNYDLQNFTIDEDNIRDFISLIYNGYLNRPGTTGAEIFYSNWVYGGATLPSVGSYVQYLGRPVFTNGDPTGAIRISVVGATDITNTFDMTGKAGVNATTVKWEILERFNADGSTTVTIGPR